MKLSEFKKHLKNIRELEFVLPTKEAIPAHFHITEIGFVNKQFIDCGGTIRNEKIITFQLWTSVDFNHRLSSEKLLQIIAIAEKKISSEDLEIEVEYQSDTIGKYKLAFADAQFHLRATQTACLAEDKCGVPSFEKIVKDMKTLTDKQPHCSPDGNCC